MNQQFTFLYSFPHNYSLSYLRVDRVWDEEKSNGSFRKWYGTITVLHIQIPRLDRESRASYRNVLVDCRRRCDERW